MNTRVVGLGQQYFDHARRMLRGSKPNKDEAEKPRRDSSRNEMYFCECCVQINPQEGDVNAVDQMAYGNKPV